MVEMRRNAPERKGHPVRMDVQDSDVELMKRRGWFVVENHKPSVVHRPEEPVEAKESTPEVVVDAEDEKKHREKKRREV